MNTLRAFGLALTVACPLALVGCGETAKVETQETIKTPGGESTITKTEKVKSTGDNPPIDVKDGGAAPTSAPR